MYKTSISRRSALKLLGATSAAGLAGCLGDDTNGEGDTGDPDLPTEAEGAEIWGERLNDHARDADIDWRQFEGTELHFGMGLHPYSTVTQTLLPWFTELTGIEVEYDIFPEDQYWLEARNDLAGDGNYDGVMTGLWQSGEFHENEWVFDLNQFIEDPSLTDQDWLAMDDFLDQTIELMTFPGDDFVGFPNGIEAYGCVGCDRPTFEMLGLDYPETFEELEEAARQISESDEIAAGDDSPREGIISRTSTTTLSSANWGTMFKTFGADWIDRSTKEAALNSPEGVESLEKFGRMMRDYGPEDPGTYNWYRANNALSIGETGMIYTTPSTSGAISEEQIERTEWLSPLPGPNGEDPIVDTWIWATGISQQSDNPEATWLFIQWANSRLGNFMLSTKQWEGHDPRAGKARLNFVAEEYEDEFPELELEQRGFTESFIEAHLEGMANVPSTPPPVPVDTPQNMNIMTEAARAMNNVVRGQQTAQDALDTVAPQITEYTQQVPDEYFAYLDL